MKNKKIEKIIQKNPIHPTFFLFFLWFLFNNQLNYFFFFFLALFSHEFGHYIMAKKLGYKLNKFYLTPLGASLNFSAGVFDNYDEIKIAVAGPLVNIFSGLFVTAFWWFFPSVYSYTHIFVFESLTLGFLNLLPAYPLDGARIVIGFLSSYKNRSNALRFLKLFNLSFSFIFLVLFIFSCFTNFNPTLFLMSFFMLTGLFDMSGEIKYESMYFYKKSARNFSKVRVLYVLDSVSIKDVLRKIDRTKITLFYVKFLDGRTKIISDEKVVKLSLIFDINSKLCEILANGENGG